mgnify:CR=1 FL=1
MLSQITAVFTRRQINIESLNVSPSSIKGVHKYTITAYSDEETMKKGIVPIFEKIEPGEIGLVRTGGEPGNR